MLRVFNDSRLVIELSWAERVLGLWEQKTAGQVRGPWSKERTRPAGVESAQDGSGWRPEVADSPPQCRARPYPGQNAPAQYSKVYCPPERESSLAFARQSEELALKV